MTTLADLHRTVQSTIASKRLGRPVFVRYTLQGLEKPDKIVSRLIQATAAVRDWLGQPLDRVYATGIAAGGQVSLTLQFREGGTAQVSFARGKSHGDGVDLLVLGNHGAIYHDAGSANLWDEPAAPPAEPPDAALQVLIERALKSGKPETVGTGGKP